MFLKFRVLHDFLETFQQQILELSLEDRIQFVFYYVEIESGNCQACSSDVKVSLAFSLKFLTNLSFNEVFPSHLFLNGENTKQQSQQTVSVFLKYEQK